MFNILSEDVENDNEQVEHRDNKQRKAYKNSNRSSHIVSTWVWEKRNDENSTNKLWACELNEHKTHDKDDLNSKCSKLIIHMSRLIGIKTFANVKRKLWDFVAWWFLGEEKRWRQAVKMWLGF